MQLADKVQLLQRTFPELPAEIVAELARKVSEHNYPMGTVLCKEGELEEVFYILCSGRVVVSKYLDGEASRILSYLGPGEFFGELAIIHDAPRVATVVTLEETSVFELNKRDFMNLLETSPMLVVTVMRAVAARLREADLRSISDLRRKNAELGRAYHALESETLQRSNFLTLVAHELRAPLATLKDSLSTLESDAPPTQLTNMLDTMTDHVNSIVHLVNNILFLQEIDLIEPQFQLIDIDQLFHEVMAEAGPIAGRLGQSIHLDLDPNVTAITGDPGNLKKALAVLIENALRFNSAGRVIYLTIRVQDQSLHISIGSPQMDIPAAELGSLFDRTETALDSPRFELPIAQAAIKQHHGTVSVAEARNAFLVRLPVAK